MCTRMQKDHIGTCVCVHRHATRSRVCVCVRAYVRARMHACGWMHVTNLFLAVILICLNTFFMHVLCWIIMCLILFLFYMCKTELFCRSHHYTRKKLLSWDFSQTSRLHPQLLSRLKELGTAHRSYWGRGGWGWKKKTEENLCDCWCLRTTSSQTSVTFSPPASLLSLQSERTCG